MICKSCKKEIASDSLYCPNCGFKNEKEGEANNTKKCIDCGKEFPENRFYCDACGGMLVQGDTVTSSDKPSQPQELPLTSSEIRVSPAGADSLPSTPINTEGQKPKKKRMSPLAIFIIAFFGTIVVSIVVFAVLIFNGAFDDGSDYTYDDGNDPAYDDVSYDDKTDDSKVYDYKYSYPQLPDVVSLDSDARFVYSADYSEQGVTVYTYLFYNENATEADLLQACEDYSILLQEENGFTYEKEYSDQQYEETGEPVNYLTRDEYGISISASTENSLHYAYISIFPLSNETQDDTTQAENNMPNYNTFLAGREKAYFSYEETVTMENGLSFMVYDVIARYPGDGTMAIDVTLDLNSKHEDYYLNNGDFMILPMDAAGNILSDAIPTSSITDSIGNNIPMPFLTSTSYENYTFTYAVPSNTTTFSIYASNVYGDGYYGPIYVMDVE